MINVISIILISSSSCHQTCVFHLSTHFFAISLKLLRSSSEHGRARRVHFIMCVVFSVARPHSHVTSPSKYRHLCLCSLLHVNPEVVDLDTSTFSMDCHILLLGFRLG